MRDAMLFPEADPRLQTILTENKEFFEQLGTERTAEFIRDWNEPPTQDPGEARRSLQYDRNLFDHSDEMTPLASVDVLLLPHAKCYGGEPGARVSLFDMLRTEWENDTHFTQYVSTADIRLRADHLPADGLMFSLMGFDLDGPEHADPGETEWWRLVQTTSWMTPQPNIVYRTTAGARFLYVIEPLIDPYDFKKRRLRLLDTVQNELGVSPFEVDTRTKDWQRLFRAPRTLRTMDDGRIVDLRKRPVWVWHCDRLDTTKKRWDPPPEPERPAGPPEPRAFNGHDRIVDGYLATSHFTGTRNDSLFSVCCWIYKAYVAKDAARLIDRVQAHAHREGLEAAETEAVAKSARVVVERERPQRP